MTSAERAAQRHLVSMWSQFPVGTRVIVRQWQQPTATISEPWINTNGVAVVRVSGWGGAEIALDRVSVASPPARAIADAIQPAPADGRLAVADGPTAFVVSAILFVLAIGACIAGRLILDGSRPLFEEPGRCVGAQLLQSIDDCGVREGQP